MNNIGEGSGKERQNKIRSTKENEKPHSMCLLPHKIACVIENKEYGNIKSGNL